jgi:hypothetical protein
MESVRASCQARKLLVAGFLIPGSSFRVTIDIVTAGSCSDRMLLILSGYVRTRISQIHLALLQSEV